MSAGTWVMDVLPVASINSATTRSLRSAPRPTSTSVAPHVANCLAAACPSPEVAPVSTMVRPVRA